MTFSKPTTREEMYEILNEIYKHYRLRKVDYQGLAFEKLKLDRLEYIPKNQQQIFERASAIANTDYQKEIAEKTLQINLKIYELSAKIDLLENNLSSELSGQDTNLALLLSSVQEDATQKGMANSGVVTQKIVQLTEESDSKKQKITAKYNGLISQAQAEKQGYQTILDNLANYYAPYYQSAVVKRTEEVTLQEEELVREVFKYNNSLDEKEKRHANSIEQVKANLDIKYAQIYATSFTKEQLVEMGYYNDVIDCVTAYFDTMDTLVAYQSITSENKLAQYLEDYYSSRVYMYRSRAGM